MAEQQEMADEDVVMLPATFDFETSLAGDTSDDDFQSMPEADMGVFPDPEPKVAIELPAQDHMFPDDRDRSNNSKKEEEGVGKKTGGRLEVVIRPLPTHLRWEYVPIKPGFEVYRVLGPIASLPDESWWSVEYEDGRPDQVAFDDLLELPNGKKALNLYERGLDFYDMGPSKKRKSQDDSDYEMDIASPDDDEVMADYDEDADDRPITSKRRRAHLSTSSVTARRSTRTSSRYPSAQRFGQLSADSRNASSGRRLRPRQSLSTQTGKAFGQDYDDADELAQSGDSDNIDIVRSDLQPPQGKRRRKRPGRAKFTSKTDRGSSVEYEPVRRSGRTTKTTKNMKDPHMDEELYAEDDKMPAVPKVISIKEVFQPLDDGDFKDVHYQVCDTCGGSSSATAKGPLIPCQGCSLMYHKVCLGYRSARDHYVTKVGPEYFVLQCRYCTLVYKKKDANSPNLDTCLSCKAPGSACKPFAPKKTAKQEEKERIANNGIDPIYQVAPNLINEANNVLFRCIECKCAFHYEHLPLPAYQEGGVVSDNIRAERLKEYSIEGKCKDCLDMPNKVGTMVAWRPTDRAAYRPGQTCNDLVEDAKEYLIKWEGKSYFHCVWKPGPWVWGVTAAMMRTSFSKRNEGENLLPKWDKKEAIPEEYLLADVILSVRYRGDIQPATKDEELEKINRVRLIQVKFQGLAYDDVVWDSPPPRNSGIIWEAFEAAFYEYLNGKYFKSEPAYKIKERISNFRGLKNFGEKVTLKDHPERLEGLLHGDLMGYQIDGVDWLLYSFYQGLNAVLADEMGLGKTVQVIALIAFLAQREPKCWPFLIVVPNSTCPNWRRELKKWAPDLRVVTYHGGKKPQQLAYDYELFPGGTKDMRAHVVVMSYDSAQDDRTKSLFNSVNWAGLVVDEGQRLKNDQNILYQALRAMKIPFRLLLTGTPLQNNKRELFNLLQFIDTSKNAEALDEEYKELTAENLPVLHKMLRPYFLRRTKKEVLHFLPPMAQIIVPVSMSVVQEKLCKSIMAKNPELIRAIFANSKMKATERGSLNNILMQLRKCLCHPFMYSGAIEDKAASPEIMFRNLIEASSKLVLLEIMLPKLKERGHRVLIFSQFLDQLDIIEDFLSGVGYGYRRLDGNISSLEKQKRIDAYNEPDSDLFAFLLSTRAGGVGINLATADTVIILDPDFNPHQDIQALSRAHRIGQKKKVLCFQLMTKDSVEEKIMQIGRKKMALDHILIETMDDQDDAGNDLESILKHGAEALFSENQKDIIKYDSASVDKLLDRSQVESTKTNADNTAESQFSLARVWANEQGTLTDDIEGGTEPEAVNPSIWENILKEREEVARREAEQNKEILGRGGRRRRAVQYTGTDYGLDDGMAVRGDGDKSDVDDDFVNNGIASDGENSDEGEGSDVMPEELQDAASAVAGNSSRKSQGKAARKAQAQLPVPSNSAKSQGRKLAEPPTRQRNAHNPHPEHPISAPVRQPTRDSAIQVIGSRPVPRQQPIVVPGSYGNPFSQRPSNMHFNPQQYPPNPHLPNGGYHPAHQGFLPGALNQSWQQHAPVGFSPYISANGSPYIRNINPGASRAQYDGSQSTQLARSISGSANGTLIPPGRPTSVLASSKVKGDQQSRHENICQKCCTQHTSSECPEINLASEIALRIALDNLRAPTSGDKRHFEERKRFLTSKLRAIVKQSLENDSEGLSSD